MCTPHAHFKKYNRKKNVKGIVFEERFCILCTLRVVNRNFEYSLFINLRSVWQLFRVSITSVIFCVRGNTF